MEPIRKIDPSSKSDRVKPHVPKGDTISTSDDKAASAQGQSKALVPVGTPRERLQGSMRRNGNTMSSFTSHLIAVDQNVPQMRRLRRIEPQSGNALYQDSLDRKAKLQPKGMSLSLNS